MSESKNTASDEQGLELRARWAKLAEMLKTRPVAIDGTDLSTLSVKHFPEHGIAPSDASRKELDRLDTSRRAATWEGSVLPALREALDLRPETRGARFVQVGRDFPDHVTATVLTRAGGRSGEIRTDTHEHVLVDIDALANDAARTVQDFEAYCDEYSPQPMPCPACLGDLPSTCRECSGPKALPRPAPEPCPTDDGEAVHEGDVVRVVEVGGDPAWRAALGREGVLTLASPDLYRVRVPGLVVGACKDFAIARRVVLVRRRSTVLAPPEGYTFREGERNGMFVHVSREDRLSFDGLPGINYFAAGHPSAFRNRDPQRWAGHEPARQWAAHLLGEVAPPLREGAA